MRQRTIIIYEGKDGDETAFVLRDVEEEARERAQAEREIASVGSRTVGYRFKTIETDRRPGESFVFE